MPFEQQPYLSTINLLNGKLEYSLSFSYNFYADPVTSLNIAGGTFTGSQFTLDPTPYTRNFSVPLFRSIAISQISTTVPMIAPSPVIIQAQDSGQVIAFGSAPSQAANYYKTNYGLFSVLCGSSNKFTFSKVCEYGTQILGDDQIWVSLFTADLPASAL